MRHQLLVGLGAGFVFLVMDGLIHANPMAKKVYAVYISLARQSVNALAGSAIDLAYGIALTFLFSTLSPSLPGRSSMAKAMMFGLIVWFFRVVMNVAGEWVSTTVPPETHFYTLLTGLAQVLLVSAFIGWLVRPASV